MTAHCTWAFANGFTTFSLSPCACFKTHTASRLSAAGKLWAAFCTSRAHSARQGIHSSSFFQVPGFLLMLSTMVSIVHLMGLRITSPQGPPCLLARLPIFLVQCAVVVSHYFRNQSALMRALKSLWTNHFELLYTCSSQAGIKRCSLLQCIVWWRTH